MIYIFSRFIHERGKSNEFSLFSFSLQDRQTKNSRPRLVARITLTARSSQLKPKQKNQSRPKRLKSAREDEMIFLILTFRTKMKTKNCEASSKTLLMLV
jgi:hypothetical protein